MLRMKQITRNQKPVNIVYLRIRIVHVARHKQAYVSYKYRGPFWGFMFSLVGGSCFPLLGFMFSCLKQASCFPILECVSTQHHELGHRQYDTRDAVIDATFFHVYLSSKISHATHHV